MTELTVEGIWDTSWDTARFDLINLRLAKILNFLVTSNATTQVTSTACTPILEQISEEILLDLKLAAQANAITVPWDFIQANISKIDRKFYDTYLLERIRKVLGYSKTIEIVTRTL